MAKKNKSGPARNVQAEQQIEKIQYALALQNQGQLEMAAFIYKEVIASDKNCVDARLLAGRLGYATTEVSKRYRVTAAGY